MSLNLSSTNRLLLFIYNFANIQILFIFCTWKQLTHLSKTTCSLRSQLSDSDKPCDLESKDTACVEDAIFQPQLNKENKSWSGRYSFEVSWKLTCCILVDTTSIYYSPVHWRFTLIQTWYVFATWLQSRLWKLKTPRNHSNYIQLP